MKRSLVVALGLLALLGPYGSTGDGFAADWNALGSAPGSAAALAGGHWLGTDEWGRDCWVRLWLGLRGSAQVVLLALGVSALVGTALGVLMGAQRAFIGRFAERSLDLLTALPLTLVALVAVAASGRSAGAVAASLGVLGAIPIARAVRLAAMAVVDSPHFRVARLHAARRWERLRWVLAPAVASSCRTACVLLLPQLLVAEGMLGFLGLSVPDPGVTLGSLLAENASRVNRTPWLVLFPGGVMFLLLLAIRQKAS